MEPDYPDDEAVAERVRLLRIAEGHETGEAFAALLGVSPTRLNNVENGMPLGKDLAFRLVQRIPGLTTDWLWFGKADHIPLELRRRLEKASGGTPTPRKR